MTRRLLCWREPREFERLRVPRELEHAQARLGAVTAA